MIGFGEKISNESSQSIHGWYRIFSLNIVFYYFQKHLFNPTPLFTALERFKTRHATGNTIPNRTAGRSDYTGMFSSVQAIRET